MFPGPMKAALKRDLLLVAVLKIGHISNKKPRKCGAS
jgi:hypothetical protein